MLQAMSGNSRFCEDLIQTDTPPESIQTRNLISLLMAREARDTSEINRTLEALTYDFGAKHIEFADIEQHCDSEEFLSLLLTDVHRELQVIGWTPGSPEMPTVVSEHFAHLLTEVDKCHR